MGNVMNDIAVNERYTIKHTPTHRVYIYDSLTESDSVLYESAEQAYRAIDTDTVEYDMELE
jgi:hypothetical protein